MSLKKIKFNGKKYQKDEITNSYIHYDNDDGTYWLLVYLEMNENWVGYTGINIVSNEYKLKKNTTYFSDIFAEYPINYNYYVYGIEHLHYVGEFKDAGENFIAFNLKQYLKIYEKKIYNKIKCKLDNDVIIWK